MGIKGLNWNEVDERVPVIAARRANITTGDKLATLVLLANRLRPEDHRAHRTRLDAINDDLRALHVMRQMEARLLDFGRACYQAGIQAAGNSLYETDNPEIARLLGMITGMTHAATPEADQSLAAPQTNGENGVTA